MFRARPLAIRQQAKQASSRNRKRRLRLEGLESRRVLAGIVVTTPLDVVDANDGVTSLREAVIEANATPGVDTIRLQPGFYHVNNGGANGGLESNAAVRDLDVTESVRIAAPQNARAIIRGTGAGPLFQTHDAVAHDQVLTTRINFIRVAPIGEVADGPEPKLHEPVKSETESIDHTVNEHTAGEHAKTTDDHSTTKENTSDHSDVKTHEESHTTDVESKPTHAADSHETQDETVTPTKETTLVSPTHEVTVSAPQLHESVTSTHDKTENEKQTQTKAVTVEDPVATMTHTASTSNETPTKVESGDHKTTDESPEHESEASGTSEDKTLVDTHHKTVTDKR